MKRKPARGRKFALILILAARLGAFAVPAALTQAQTPNSPTASSSESQQQQLTEAQRRYYEAQAAKLNDERSTWQKVVNLGAFLAAFVAVLSLVLNYSSTLRMQRDTQFFEALKRFGDQDSPAARSSAAGLLAKLSNQKGIILRWQRPNFDIALDQLMAGSLLENNPVCLTSIKGALRQLTTYSPFKVIQKIRNANLAVRTDMVKALAAFMATKSLDAALGAGDHWSDAAALTPYEAKVLHTDVRRYENVFRREHKTANREYYSMDEPKKRQQVLAAQKALRLAGNRSDLNVEIFGIVLKTSPFRGMQFKLGEDVGLRGSKNRATRLGSLFLVQADLRGVKLKGVDLEEAHLEGANFEKAHLEGANFEKAHLQGANLKGARLEDAKLNSIKIDENTDLENSNWWEANFEADKRIDADLLEELFSRYAHQVPKSAGELHSSVRSFMEKAGRQSP